MKAAIFNQHGGPEVIEIAEVPRPAIGEKDVLIAVHSAGLNHLDLWARRGLPGLELQFPHIGGADVAGTIAELGSDVQELDLGDRVLINPALWCGRCEWCRADEESLCASFRVLGEHTDGGFAEYISVPARNVMRIPDELPFEDAAAVPLTFQTAWRGLISRGQLRAGETVLITGASGGVATAAVQIAKYAGARVFAVTSGPEKSRRVEELGADLVIDRLETEFSAETWKATEKRGVDLVFDSVGEAIWSDAMRALAKNGRLVTYGATTGYQGAVDIRRTFWKQLRIIGTTMASASEFQAVISLVFEGKLRPVVDVVWPLDHARQAHERLESGAQFGKIILSVASLGS